MTASRQKAPSGSCPRVAHLKKRTAKPSLRRLPAHNRSNVDAMTEVNGGTCAVVIVAAGSGERLGQGVPKARVPLGSEPLLVHAIRGVIRAGVATQICVAIPADDDEMAALCRRMGGEVATAGLRFNAVQGGADRSASVLAALSAVGEEITTVMVHDAARPLTPSGVFKRVAAALHDGAKAVIPALSVTDTIKTVVPAILPATGAGVEKVLDTPSRGQLRAVQTPQGFDLETLRRAHAQQLDGVAAAQITDDAMLVEALGEEVFVVQGSTHSFKVTTPMDLLLAEAMLEGPLRPRWVEG